MRLSHFLFGCTAFLAACGPVVTTGTDQTTTPANLQPWQPDCGHVSMGAYAGQSYHHCKVIDPSDSSVVLGVWEFCTYHSIEEHGGKGWEAHSYLWALTNCIEYVPE